MSREHSAEEVDDFARRMAWESCPELAKEGFRQMAKLALVTHDELVERMAFDAIVNPPEGS